MAKVNGVVYSSAESPQHPKHIINQGTNYHRRGTGHLSLSNLKFSSKGFWHLGQKLNKFVGSQGSSLVCQSTETQNTETKKHVRRYSNRSNKSSSQSGDEQPIETVKSISSGQGLTEACRFVSNDAKFVNERAKNDIVLLSRSIMKLDARARQDVAFLGSEFLKLDARAKEDTEKIDHDVKKRAERLHHVALFLKNIAQSRLKSAADKHWSDGALEADLKRADSVAKQRAMEDSLMALEHWEKDIPPDPTGELDSLWTFIKENADVFMWIGIAIITIQVLSLLLAIVLRSLVSSPREDDDIEGDYGSRSSRREPLLSPYSGQSSGSTRGDSDIWSSRMREKYGLSTSGDAKLN